MSEKKFVYKVDYRGGLVKYELIKETPQKYLTQITDDTYWVSKSEYFLSAQEAYEHAEQRARKRLQDLKDKTSVERQTLGIIEKELAKIKRDEKAEISKV